MRLLTGPHASRAQVVGLGVVKSVTRKAPVTKAAFAARQEANK